MVVNPFTAFRFSGASQQPTENVTCENPALWKLQSLKWLRVSDQVSLSYSAYFVLRTEIIYAWIIVKLDSRLFNENVSSHVELGEYW